MEYEYNKNIKNTKYSLIKKAITGLFGINILALSLTACGKDIFEYDQSKDTPLSEQYEEHINKELSFNVKGQLNQLRPYEISVDEYNDLLSVDASREDKVSARVEIVNDTKSLINASYAIIEIKIIEKLNLSNKASFEYVNIGNSVDGPSYIIKISDSDKNYEISNIPTKISRMINLIDSIKSYQGTGESKAWDKDMNGYIEKTEELYYSTLEVASDTDIKIKAKEVETKVIH